MQMNVNFSDNSYMEVVYVPYGEYRCGDFTVKSNTVVASSTVVYRRPAELPIQLARDGDGEMMGVVSFFIDPGESTYQIYPLMSDIIITEIKIIVAWWVLVLAFFQSVKIASRVKILGT